ncbi:hypothetical protein VP01_7683g1, partial [Puccinia sorghi]
FQELRFLTINFNQAEKFDYLCGFYPGSDFFECKWAATSGCVIYLDLKEAAMLNCLKLWNSLHFQKFTLIHDVWTTKGNHFGFIGGSVSFISNDWNYISFSQVSCLAPQRKLKTDSGSKKNTMARMMHQKIYKLEGPELSWDCDTMHIKCFFHKMALFVNSGLNKLGLEALL